MLKYYFKDFSLIYPICIDRFCPSFRFRLHSYWPR